MRAGTVAPATRGAIRIHEAGMHRSMRAGTVAPATLLLLGCGLWRGSPLNEGRDRGPGNTRRRRRTSQGRGALNEGRDRGPGNTSTHRQSAPHTAHRSMRAGTVAPATRDGANRPGGVRVGRSMRAGTVAPATPVRISGGRECTTRSMRAGTVAPATRFRRPVQRRQHWRSMRAGTVAPATRLDSPVSTGQPFRAQ